MRTREGKEGPIDSDERFLAVVEGQVMKKGKAAIANLKEEVKQPGIAGIEHVDTVKRLGDSKEYLKVLFESAPDAYYLNDLKGTFVDGNKAAEEMMGYKRHELIGKTFLKLKLLPPQQIPKAVALLTKNALGKPTGPNEFTLNRKDGSQVEVEIRTQPVKIEGQPLVLGIARDITERKQVEKELRIKDSALATSINAIALADLEGKVTYANSSFLKLWRHDDDKEVLGKSVADFWEKAEDAWEVVEALQNTGAWSGELVAKRTDGSTFGVELIANLVTDEVGVPICMMASFIDITERKQAEEALQISQHFLEIANRHTEMIPLLNKFVAECKDFTGCDAVGIRLLDEERNIPYEAYEGFSQSFYESESPLSIKADQCMCINVIKGKTDSKLPFYTEGGSFFMNGTSRFLATVSEEEKGRTRNVCNQYGYESVALIPIRVEDQILGVIHFADPGENMVPCEKVEVMEEAAMQLGMALRRVQAGEILRRTLESTIQAVGLTTEMRDPYTAGHQKRVTQLACAIAKEVGLSQEQFEGIRAAGLVHDIGKMSIPAEILSKPSKLTDLEFHLVEGHPQVAYDILKTIEFPWPLAQIVLQHHERMDGSGYPQGLKGEEIMVEARILAVADVVEAMASFRPYRPALGIDKALEEISQNKGILFDTDVVDACMRLFEEKKFQFED